MNRDLKTLTIFFRTRNTLERRIRQDIAQHGLNATEFGVLEILYHKGPQTVNSILQKVLVQGPSLTYALKSLEKRGWITRKKMPHDKRVYQSSLTEEGHDFIAKIYPKHEQNLRSLLDVFTPEEEKTFQRLLKKLGKQKNSSG